MSERDRGQGGRSECMAAAAWILLHMQSEKRDDIRSTCMFAIAIRRQVPRQAGRQAGEKFETKIEAIELMNSIDILRKSRAV